jgi:glycosyltransferase involved in cell wall biosynthesis
MMEGVVDLYLPETNIDPYSAPALKWLGAFLRHRPEFDILHCTYHKGLYEVALADGRPRIVTVHSDGYRWLHEVKSPDRTVIISDWQGAMLPEWIRGPKREKIVNGIEVEGFAKPSGWAGYKEAYRSSFTYPRRDGQEPVVALWVGRLHKTKGLETLRAIAERWLPGAPNRHLAIVGQAHDEAVNVQMRKWMGQVERVSWIEYIEPEQMPWAYAAADIYLHTAPCEGFGLTVAEAQASGLPVVALEAPGVNEIVVHGETGSLSPLGGAEVDRLVGSLDYLAGDKRLRRRMGRAGQKRARELFTAERMGNEYLELYRWVASHSRGA